MDIDWGHGSTSSVRSKGDSPQNERHDSTHLGSSGIVPEALWEEGFEYLQAFVRENGHCEVSDAHVAEDGYPLGQWVRVQRRQKDRISAERKTRLDALGFIWDVLARQWEVGFQHLAAFVRENGHCRVLATHVAADGYPLGQWVKVQRRRRTPCLQNKRSRLDGLGFVWDVLADQWEEGFQHLKAFVTEHGHCRVSFSHLSADGYRLGQWVQVQRRRRGHHAGRTKSTPGCAWLRLGYSGKRTPSRRGVVIAWRRVHQRQAVRGAVSLSERIRRYRRAARMVSWPDHFPAKRVRLVRVAEMLGRACSGGRTHRGACYILGF